MDVHSRSSKCPTCSKALTTMEEDGRDRGGRDDAHSSTTMNSHDKGLKIYSRMIAVKLVILFCIGVFVAGQMLLSPAELTRDATAILPSLSSNPEANQPSDSDLISNVGDGTMTTTTNTTTIHACARFTTRYDALHILPWLVHHKRLGISHFHLYFDSLSSNLRKPAEKKAYDAIVQAPFATVYDTKKLDIYMQHKSLEHCWKQADADSSAEWVIDFDIDEAFAVGKYLKEQKDCKEVDKGDAAGELSAWASTLPKDVLAVVIPRVAFGTNGILDHPEETQQTQMDLYTRRERTVRGGAKIMLRTQTGGNAKYMGKHEVAAVGRDSVIYPCGKTAALRQCDMEQNNDGTKRSMCIFGFNETDYSSDLHLSAPRLHHYSRSLHERSRKSKDIVMFPWHNASTTSEWEVKSARHKPNPTTANVLPDYSLYCAGIAAGEKLKQLFPSWS